MSSKYDSNDPSTRLRTGFNRQPVARFPVTLSTADLLASGAAAEDYTREPIPFGPVPRRLRTAPVTVNIREDSPAAPPAQSPLKVTKWKKWKTPRFHSMKGNPNPRSTVNLINFPSGEVLQHPERPPRRPRNLRRQTFQFKIPRFLSRHVRLKARARSAE